MRNRLLCLAVVWCGLVAAESLPDPWRISTEPWIGPAAVPVMEQMFWVQLSLTPETAVRVETPPGVSLLDQTRPGTARAFSRFYFRAAHGLKNARITFLVAGADRVDVPLTVLTYREDLEQQIRRVPGVDPTVRKQGRSYYTEDRLTVARENLARYPELAVALRQATRYDGKTDTELWRSFPSYTVPRECYGDWPCPQCGAAIFKKSAFYPWQRGREHPFKARCPKCGQLFPTNDYLAGDFTSGAYPDDGWGFDPGTGREDAYAWIAHYNHHAVWMDGRGLEKMGERYLLFDDRAAAHAAGVVLARLAYVYPGLDFRWQQARPRYLGRRGRALLDGNWERNLLLVPALKAYDAVFDYLDDDTELVEFLHQKDPAISAPADVKALIDTCLVQVAGWDWMRRELSGGNQGAREQDMAVFAVCANMGEVTARWLEELFTHAYNSGTNRGGFDDETLINTLTREGLTLVSGLGYAMGYLKSKSDMAEILAWVTDPRWRQRCDLYDPRQYPKFRAEFDAWIDLCCAGQFAPSYGDSGAGRAARFPKGLAAGVLRVPYERAYRRWPTDRIARALYQAGPRLPDVFEPSVWAQVEAQAKRIGPAPPRGSRVLDGVGFVILESRADASEVNARAAVSLRYGYALGHHHHDNLNIEMWAHGDVVAPELGYPCWAHRMGDTKFVAHHNTGMIDRRGQYQGGVGHGALEMFAAAPEASFADVSAAPNGFPNRVYRRAVCLADAPGGNVYLLDVLRLAGGQVRTYCFHGPGHDVFDSSLTAFGTERSDASLIERLGRRFGRNIVDLQATAADSAVWADWRSDLDASKHLRLHLLASTGRRYLTARCAKPDIPEIRYLFAEDEAPDGASEFVALWAPYVDAPHVKAVERLSVTGAAPGEFAPVAVRVTLAGGQTDTFIYSFDAQTRLRVGDLEFQGSFGYWSTLAGRPRCAHLVNGGCLQQAGVGIQAPGPPYEGVVLEVDCAQNMVKLDRDLPTGLGEPGQMLYFRGGPHRTAYPILERISADLVRLDLNGIIFRSRIMGFSEDRQALVAEMNPRIPGSGGASPHGYYDGALVTGEDLRARYRVAGIDGETIRLERPATEEDFPDTDGDGRRLMLIYDIGPGDRVAAFRSVYADLRATE